MSRIIRRTATSVTREETPRPACHQVQRMIANATKYGVPSIGLVITGGAGITQLVRHYRSKLDGLLSQPARVIVSNLDGTVNKRRYVYIEFANVNDLVMARLAIA